MKDRNNRKLKFYFLRSKNVCSLCFLNKEIPLFDSQILLKNYPRETYKSYENGTHGTATNGDSIFFHDKKVKAILYLKKLIKYIYLSINSPGFSGKFPILIINFLSISVSRDPLCEIYLHVVASSID